MKKYASILALLAISATALHAAPPTKYLISVPSLRLAQDITADGYPPARLRLVFEPATADASGAKWESSDPSVATVSQDGTLDLLKVGETDVTVSFGGVKSIPCKVTVLPPENRSMANRNLRSVPRVKKGEERIDKWAFLAMPENYGDAVIALWADDKVACYSMTSDDAPYGDISRWLSIFEKWGGAITMGLVVGQKDANYTKDFHNVHNMAERLKGKKDRQGKGWREWLEAGNDIQSHTLTHHNRDGWLSSDFMYDMYKSRDEVQELLEEEGLAHLARSQTFIAGFGGWPSEYLSRFYTAGRNGGSIYPDGNNCSSKASPDDYLQVDLTSVCGFEHSDELIRPYIDPTIEAGTAPDAHKYRFKKHYGGLRNVLVHMIDGGLDSRGLNFASNIEWIYDNYLHDNRHILWYDNFTNMTSYAQERDASTLKVTEKTPNRIAFTLDQYLDSSLFDYPLTVKVKLDPSWNKLTVTQDGKPVKYYNGKPAESYLVRRGGHTYAFVKAVPDRGLVVLTKEGAEKKFSGNATLAKLEYRPDVKKMHDNPRLMVPAFSPDKTEYAVTLPPGTPTVGIYGLTACEGARSKRDPIMGTVEVSAAEGPRTATVTVTAEDETVKVYTVTFTVEDYAPVDALKLAAFDCRGAAPNLAQVTTSEIVAFTVRSGKETLDEAGKVTGRNYDPDTVEWFVNGVAQEAAKGTEFDYLPQKYGTYEIHARMGKVDSNKIAIAFTKGAPKPGVTILAEDFSRHAVGKPVPLSDDPAANLFSATSPNISTEAKLGEQGMKIVAIENAPAVPSGKAAAWTTPDPTFWTGLQKNYPHSATEPIAVTFKTRIDTIDTVPAHPVNFHILGGAATAARTHPVFSFNQIGTWGGHKPDITFKPGWNGSSQKWMSVAYVFDPSRRRPENPNVLLYDAVYVGNENYLDRPDYDRRSGAAFMDHPGYGGRHHNSFNEDGDRALVLSFTAGPRDLANLGKCTTYLADVRIYRPGSWIMTPAKPAFGTNEAVRMNFTHHANINTIKPDRVKVTDSKGAAVAVESTKTDPMNFDHFEMTFAAGTLKKGETYTVDLDENVRDIMDKTVYDVATFKVQ